MLSVISVVHSPHIGCETGRPANALNSICSKLPFFDCHTGVSRYPVVDIRLKNWIPAFACLRVAASAKAGRNDGMPSIHQF
jgi:hypothetical protein